MLRAHPHALALAVLLALVPDAAPAQARRLELADVGRIVRLGDPQLSPDGRTVIVAVSRADLAANAWRTELVAVDVASGAQRVVAPGLRAVGHARWSSRGDRVAFLAAAPGGGRQIYLMPAAGGPPAVLTRSATGVEAFAWRPDGGALALAAADPRAERAADTDPFEVGNDHYMTSAAPRPSHVWLVPAAGGAARRLTKGAWSLITSISDASLSWAPDGGSIALVQIASASPGDADQGIVVVVDTAGRERRLTGRAAGEGGARFSPDGSRIAYSYARDGVPANVEEVVVAPAAGGEGESATRGIDRQVGLVDWWPDGQGLLVLGTDGTRAALWSQPLGGAARKLPLGDIAEIAGASVSRSGAIALVASEPARPQELYVIERPGAPPRRLTRFNEDVAKLALGRSERVTWTTHDGMTADGVVTYPPGFDPARKYPLVLHIHGGPTASSNEAFLARAQLLAARGWVVLQPNYRGSDNLGNAFQRAIADDAGEGPGRDVVAGVDALVARGFVDTARVAVSGWSYGGFMTAWLIGRYPERWRAAVAGAAPVDLTDMYALADLNVMRRHAITASPFVGDNLAKYMAMSPITHLSKARAPTLVMSQTADVRVTVTGSYKIFHALKDNGVPVQFVAFPGGGHSPADPVRLLERERRWVEWLERWMK